MVQEAPINEKCIIGLPTCGYAFSSARMAFIAAPADDEFALELDVLKGLLEEKGYEAYVALRNIDPGKFAFCTKICSKIITSQFCVVLLNPSGHREYPDVVIPNPNVHMEYGLMLGFRKYILPFQRKGASLAFNIQPLDTLIYSKGEFRKIADQAIDTAILTVGTTARPTRALPSSELLLRYLTVRGLRVTSLDTEDARNLHGLGSFLGFYLLDGVEIVYFGMFDAEPPKEVAFRTKLLLQNLHHALKRFYEFTSKTMTPEQITRVEGLRSQIRIEVLVADELDRPTISRRISELTAEYAPFPWRLVVAADLQRTVDEEYGRIGEL
jgi:hypothetical protein